MKHTSKALAAYIGGLRIGQGRYAGQPFKLLPWQSMFLRGAFSTDDDAALTLARGGGKTTLIAAIGAASVVGGAGFGFKIPQTGRRLKIGKPGRAWRCSVPIRGGCIRTRPHWSLATNSRSGREPRLTRCCRRCVPAWARFPALGPCGSGPVRRRRIIHSSGCCPVGAGIPKYTRRAVTIRHFSVGHGSGRIPSLDHLPDLEARIRREAADAKRDPSALASFQALRLNLGVSDVTQSTLLDAGTWARIEGAAECRGRFVLGVDLGTSAAMSAAADYWPETGALRAFAVFPELPDLRERGLRDGVGRLYQEMARRGELIQAGRRVSDIGALLRLVRDRWGRPGVIVVDRWRLDELREHLDGAGLGSPALVVRGQGFKDGSEDVRDFRRACLDGRAVPEVSLLLRAAMSEARVLVDARGLSSRWSAAGWTLPRRRRCRACWFRRACSWSPINSLKRHLVGSGLILVQIALNSFSHLI